MFTKADNFIKTRNPNAILAVVVAILTLLGIRNRFIQDDAFISFRYAQHLANGHGLTWNIGDEHPVEGYTNFLWTLLMAAVEAVDGDPVFWSMALGILFGICTLYFTYRLALMVSKSVSVALLAIILLGTNYTFSSYMTGGLETQLQTCLVVVSAYCSVSIVYTERFASRWWLIAVSLLYALAVLTRPDTALICGVLYLFVAYHLLTKQISHQEKLFRILYLTIPGLIVVGVWLAFKVQYYGDILPNTYYLKAQQAAYEFGLFFTRSFLLEYSILAFVLLGVFFARELFSNRILRLLIVIIIIWSLYIIRVGGDFMEYRFYVAVLPFLFITVAQIILLIGHAQVQAAITALLLISSISHAATFTYRISKGIESFTDLEDHIVSEYEGWQRVGIVFGELFSQSNDPITIATRAAGAIPYYSKLPTVDMLGLNDRKIAREGAIVSTRPGHTHAATLEYLLESDVNLIIGHPKVKPLSDASTRWPGEFFEVPIDTALFPETSRVIEIPLDSGYKIDVLYLLPHKDVDALIQEMNLATHEIYR